MPQTRLAPEPDHAGAACHDHIARRQVLTTPARDALFEAIGDPRYRVVSFDLFDTLIRRRVMAPDHVFWSVAEEFARTENDPALVETIHDARVHAGEISISRARLRGMEDSTLSEIYQALADILPAQSARMSEMMQMELSAERRVLEPYPFGRTLYEAARNAGKRIVIASDQYLPMGFLEELVDEFGYDAHERFFLSGECRLLKASGSLYHWMPLALGVERGEILHIGDNQHVDVKVARRKGIAGMPVPMSVALAGYSGRKTASGRLPGLASRATAEYLNQLADSSGSGEAGDPDPFDFIGYSFYGPLLTYLACWLTEPLRQGSVDRIWMLARDGEGLHKVTGALFPEHTDRVDYVYASRKMLVYPTGELSGVEILRHFNSSARSRMTVEDFLGRISTADADFTPLAAKFVPGALVQDVRARLAALLDVRAAEIRAQGQTQTRERLRAYYLDMAREADRIAVFDLGWRGNLQRALEAVLGGSGITLTGHYLGLMHEEAAVKSRIAARGFAFTNGFPAGAFDDISRNIWPLELIFGGTEPSCADIRRLDEGWQPVFEVDTPAKERMRGIAARLQAGALRFARSCAGWHEQPAPDRFDLHRGVDLIREFLARPDRSDAAIFESLGWAMNIDDDEFRLIARVAGKGGRALSRARAASVWPAGFDALQEQGDLQQLHAYWASKEKRRKKLSIRRTFDA